MSLPKEVLAFYGYLSTPARNLVNGIIDELAKDSRIAELYELWYEQRDKVVQTYQNAGDDRVPLSQNKTFHPIRNAVVTEALKLSLEDSVFEEIPEENLPNKEKISSYVPDREETASWSENGMTLL